MKITPVRIKKIIPAKKIITDTPFPVVIIDAALDGLEAIIVPPDKENVTLNSQLRLTLRTRNRRIKKLVDALLAAHASMHAFTQQQEALNEELRNVNEEVLSSNEELQAVNEELQTRNDLLNESYDYSEAIIATIHEPMIILDKDLRVRSANKSFYINFRVKAEETEGTLLYDLGNKQWNIPRLSELLENIISNNTHFTNFEVIHTFPDIGEKIMLLNASRILQKSQGGQLILLAIEDITEVRMKTLELQLKEKELFNKDARERQAENVRLEQAVEERTKELAQVNKELVFQNEEKEKRAAELIIANKELVFQNQEKENRAAELFIANRELVFQNKEKENRASELIIANKELAFQNEEKEKRAAELIIANKELLFQNKEKEKRAAELIIANKELAFQNEEKEKRAAELIVANKELEAFNYIASHDLQEPLRKMQSFAAHILDKEDQNLSIKGKDYLRRMQSAAGRMQRLIEDLLTYSRTNVTERTFEKTGLGIIIEDVKTELKETIAEKHATIETREMCDAYIIPFQFRQLMYNLISNALKFSKPEPAPHIIISSSIIKGYGRLSPDKTYCHITVADNGIGFEPKYSELIFGVFQKLHAKEEYKGTGIGLAIVKKIVENHYGIIIATGELNKGAKFDIYIPMA